MKCRTIERSDASVLLSLWNAVAHYDPLTPALLAEKLWGDAEFSPVLALVEETAAAPAGFAVAVVRDTNGVKGAYLKLLAVAPKSQRQGVATRLLHELEQRPAGLGATELRLGEGAPNYLTPGVDSRYAAAIKWAERRGFTKVGETCNQMADLRELPPELGNDLPPSITITRSTLDDELSLRQLLDTHWPSWNGEVRVALNNTPRTVFVALEDERVVGFAAYDANNLGTGWFGPMGVDARLQGRGVGRALLLVTLADMRQAGYDEAVIPWVGPVEFYRRHVGAEISRTFFRYAKPLGS